MQSAGTNVEASLRVLASPGQHSSEVGNEMKCILACIHIQLIQHAIQFMIKLQHPLIAYRDPLKDSSQVVRMWGEKIALACLQ